MDIHEREAGALAVSLIRMCRFPIAIAPEPSWADVMVLPETFLHVAPLSVLNSIWLLTPVIDRLTETNVGEIGAAGAGTPGTIPANTQDVECGWDSVALYRI